LRWVTTADSSARQPLLGLRASRQYYRQAADHLLVV
jgi:hypothetical protein